MRHLVPIAIAGLLASASPTLGETIRLTVVAGAPPHVTYVKAAKEKWIPEINRRLKESGKDIHIEWTEAYAQTLAKFTEVCRGRGRRCRSDPEEFRGLKAGARAISQHCPVRLVQHEANV